MIKINKREAYVIGAIISLIISLILGIIMLPALSKFFQMEIVSAGFYFRVVLIFFLAPLELANVIYIFFISYRSKKNID